MSSRALAWVPALWLVGCSSVSARPDAGSADAAEAEDAVIVDVGAPAADAGVAAVDAAPSPDAGADAGGPAADAGAPASDAGVPSPDAGMAALRLPPLNGGLDYQLGGAYPPPANVSIVSRDRSAAPAPGLYNICYLNGFQIQPDEVNTWMTQHPEMMLRDSNGALVIDQDWNEILIDIRTPAQRDTLAAVVGEWIRGCKTAGFDAIEIDNLDSYSRSGGLLTEDQAVLAMHLISDLAHAQNLAIAQKNSAELVGRRAELGTDFVVAEECNRYSECGTYTAGYGDHVLVIEYRRADFSAGCAAYPNLSIVLRDRNLVTPGQGAYVYDGC
ncbi:MAG: endo alpha-1,4 polygalactosaminidase [Myxococcota bacterium]